MLSKNLVTYRAQFARGGRLTQIAGRVSVKMLELSGVGGGSVVVSKGGIKSES